MPPDWMRETWQLLISGSSSRRWTACGASTTAPRRETSTGATRSRARTTARHRGTPPPKASDTVIIGYCGNMLIVTLLTYNY